VKGDYFVWNMTERLREWLATLQGKEVSSFQGPGTAPSLNLLALELDIYSLAHHFCKM